MTKDTSYEFEVAILDKLLKEKKISYQEWYVLLIELCHKYNLPCINNINYIDIKSVLRQYTHDGKGSN
ncbi:MAG: hypothetical protein SPL00_01620 [Bacilli bacterium]|nr:hypothetical protein [Bacilli bacterium]